MPIEKYEAKSAWEVYEDRTDEIEKFAAGYVAFLSRCKTERETVEFVAAELRRNGYAEAFGGELVFRVCRDKALFAARKGKRPLRDGVSLIAAHADAPRLDLKQHPLMEQASVGQAKTHYYGGIRKYQWLARPLAIHGVVVRENGDVVKVSIGEKADDPVFTIADLLPHLAYKEVTKTVQDAFDAERLNVIVGHRPASLDKKERKGQDASPVKMKVLEILRKKYKIDEEDLFSAELETVPAGPASFVGFDKALVGGYGQDDRVCVYTAMRALLAAEKPEHACAVMFWDKEEIGSDGATGAQSTFLENCLKDLADSWEPGLRFRDFIVKSRALSADVHAAMDPDFQEYHEKLNSALLGYGACFCKFTGSRGKYGANDAHPEYIGRLRGILNRKGIPWQMAELGKVDLGGGGTVALYLAAYGMDVIDCGPALLGMHSPFELSSCADVFGAYQVYKAFFEEA